MIYKDKIIHWRYAPFLMVILGGIFYCYEYVLRISPSVMIHQLGDSFDLTYTQIGMLSSYYYWGYTAGSILVGPFIDRFAPKLVLVWASIFCALGCVAFGFSESFFLAKLARLAIGFGSAFAFIGVLKIGAVWLEPKYFGRLAGCCSMLGMASAWIGQNFLSSLMHAYSWQSISLYSGILGGIIAAIIGIFLIDQKPSAKKIRSYQNKPESFASLFNAFRIVGRQKIFWVNCIIGITTFLPILVFAELWGVPFLQERYLIPNSQATLYVSLVYLGWAVGGPCFGLLFDFLKKWRIIFLTGTLLAALTSWAVLFANMPVFLLPATLFMFGFSASSHVLVFVSSRLMAPKGIEATTLGITNLLMMSSGVIIQPFIGKVIDYMPQFSHVFGMQVTTMQAFQCALAILPIALFVTVWLINNVGNSMAKPAKRIPRPAPTMPYSVHLHRYQYNSH